MRGIDDDSPGERAPRLRAGVALEPQVQDGGRDRTRTCDLLRVKQAL